MLSKSTNNISFVHRKLKTVYSKYGVPSSQLVSITEVTGEQQESTLTIFTAISYHIFAVMQWPPLLLSLEKVGP